MNTKAKIDQELEIQLEAVIMLNLEQEIKTLIMPKIINF